MNYLALLYLFKMRIPLEITKYIDSYLISTRTWHIICDLDNFEISNKFKLCRQISLNKDQNNFIFLYSIIWNNIINYKKIYKNLRKIKEIS